MLVVEGAVPLSGELQAGRAIADAADGRLSGNDRFEPWLGRGEDPADENVEEGAIDRKVAFLPGSVGHSEAMGLLQLVVGDHSDRPGPEFRVARGHLHGLSPVGFESDQQDGDFLLAGFRF